MGWWLPQKATAHCQQPGQKASTYLNTISEVLLNPSKLLTIFSDFAKNFYMQIFLTSILLWTHRYKLIRVVQLKQLLWLIFFLLFSSSNQILTLMPFTIKRHSSEFMGNVWGILYVWLLYIYVISFEIFMVFSFASLWSVMTCSPYSYQVHSLNSFWMSSSYFFSHLVLSYILKNNFPWIKDNVRKFLKCWAFPAFQTLNISPVFMKHTLYLLKPEKSLKAM